ncbi:hypothetical protein [Halobacteriovorax sp. HLS]|uniref:hypothetical protein n=1 Tax=Halobacteriovorax sp. HLS TaxID=2234000 RepID=UPI000FDBCB47|nr:hypothetical protein [Halobacteriovorax sp. HLS]
MKIARLVLITSFLLVAVSQFTSASESTCIDNLTDGYTADSATHTLNINDLEIRDYGNDHVAFSIKIVRELLEEVGCRRNDVNFGRGSRGRSHSRCEQVLRGTPSSRVCYVESNLGYFFVTRDLLTNVHITFNRWD